MEQQVDFKRDSYRLFGMLHTPEQVSLRAAVLFLHGFGGQRSESGRLFVRTARRLAPLGIASLRFDFAGSGDSEGEDVDSSILSQLEDAVVAFRLLRAMTRRPSSALGVVGYSLGGAMAALLGAREALGAMVLWAPVSDPIRNFAEHLEINPQEFIQRPTYDAGLRRVGRQFLEELPDIRPLDAAEGFQGHLLAIHGTEDQVVKPYNSDHYIEAVRATAQGVARVDIEGAGHSFSGLDNSEELIEQTVAWFAARLK